jgi:hypothetical protein
MELEEQDVTKWSGFIWLRIGITFQWCGFSSQCDRLSVFSIRTLPRDIRKYVRIIETKI